jgi:hypothetical protein
MGHLLSILNFPVFPRPVLCERKLDLSCSSTCPEKDWSFRVKRKKEETQGFSNKEPVPQKYMENSECI